jgi:glucuronate isomerase
VTVSLHPDRYFSPDLAQHSVMQSLYCNMRDLPLICPHRHVEPRLFSDPHYRFDSPVELLTIPDHYIFRMLYASGIPLESLGIPTQDRTPVESDHCKIWQTFTKYFYHFRATLTGIWLTNELKCVFGITDKLDSTNVQRIYDHIAERLMQPEDAPTRPV